MKVYKKVYIRQDSLGYHVFGIATLKLEPESLIIKTKDRKFRIDKAKVLKIEVLGNGGKYDSKHFWRPNLTKKTANRAFPFHTLYRNGLAYEVGKIAKADRFDIRFKQCSNGIHV